MALYFFKPVVWNAFSYNRAGGANFTSGYPKQNGFGWEEWNNSDCMLYQVGNVRMRAFHMEKFGNQPLEEYAEDFFVMMIASNLGKQYLVAISAKTTSYLSQDKKDKRLNLVSKLKLLNLWNEAWSINKVNMAFNNDEKKFQRHWKTNVEWLPTFICPEEYYLALKNPLELDPQTLVGRNRLITMFSSYQETNRNVALRVLDSILQRNDMEKINRLKDMLGSDASDVENDITDIERRNAKNTTRQTLINARLGQGKFRAELKEYWENACAVTGCQENAVLRASHIKPWRDCKNRERLNSANGILLEANLDALFDNGLISFAQDGTILISKLIERAEVKLLNLDGLRLRKKISKDTENFLSVHRQLLRGNA
jgi:hypothetical protein